MVKAILRYPGAKWELSKWICSNLPPHSIYVEPFFGSGAVFFGKKPVKTETLNDVDGNVVNLFKIIRERSEELCRVIELTPWARDEYFSSYSVDETADELEQARLFLVRCWQAFGSRNGARSGWRNRTTGSSPKEPSIWRTLPERVRIAAERLRYAQIENMDAINLIQRYNAPNCLIYADPPYMPDTRSRGIYAHECDEAYHEQLLYALEAHIGSVVLSGYNHPLYNERLRHWKRIEKTTCVERAARRTEILWIKEADGGK